MRTPPSTNELISQIYDATFDVHKWPVLLSQISQAVDARGAFIFDLETDGMRDSLRATQFSSTYDPKLVQSYLDKFSALEIEDQRKFARSSRQTDTVELIPDDVLAPDHNKLMQRANAAQMARWGIHYRMGGLLNKDKTGTDRFALQFSRRAGLPTGERLQTLNTLLPHIAKALNLGHHASRLISKHNLVAQSYDALRIGVCVLTRDSQIIHTNAEFQRQSDQYGVFQISKGRTLRIKDAETQLAINRLTSDINEHGRFGARPRKEAVIQPISTDERDLCIEICPLHSPDFVNGEIIQGYALFSLDTSQMTKIDTGYIARSYELTESEEGVLALVADGLTNVQISEQRNRSRETINSQVKSLLMKTMTANRTQLMRLALQYSAHLFVNDPDKETSAITHLGDEGKLTAT